MPSAHAADILVGNSLDLGKERVVCSQRVATVPCFGKKCSAENRSPEQHTVILFSLLVILWFCYRSLNNGKIYVNAEYFIDQCENGTDHSRPYRVIFGLLRTKW